jgi:hypothetical protein
LIVFGVDHFLALAPIGTLIPSWIPWHVFWIAFFGAVFIGAGLSIGLNLLLRCGAAAIGFMFAIWVFTLHFPRVLGLYGIPGAPTNPAEWSSLLIAVALWGARGRWQTWPASPSQKAMPFLIGNRCWAGCLLDICSDRFRELRQCDSSAASSLPFRAIYQAQYLQWGSPGQGANLRLRFRNRSSNNRRERSDAGIAMAETIKKRVKSIKVGSMVDEIPVFLTKWSKSAKIKRWYR